MPELSPENFDQFYTRNFTKLVGFVRGLGVSQGDAEDAAQNAMIELFKKMEEVENPAAWVRVVARLDAYRKVRRGRRDSWVMTLLAAVMPAVGTTLPDPAEEVGGNDRVIRLLCVLPLRDREVTVWGMGGFTVAETAEAMGIPENEVTNARRRARTRLARVIAREAPDLLDSIRQRTERES